VKKRFIPDEFFRVGEHEQFSRVWVKNGRAFFPARLEDNPHLNTEEYERDALSQLDPVTRAQLRKGDWTAHAGGRFDRAWWRRYRRNVDLLVLDGGEYLPLQEVPRIVLVDPAGRKTKASKFTAIGTYGDFGRQRVGVLEMVRKQLRVEEIVPELERVCARWQPAWVGIEANGFQMFLVQAARGRPGIPTVMEMEPEGKSKLTRATPAIIRAEQGLFYLPDEADWLDEFETEHQMFTGDEKLDAYSDQVDVSAYAVLGMDKYGVGGMVPPLGVLSLR
jgi:predicted phage terminase large subunit-like protein